jgi:hypothetical protein
VPYTTLVAGTTITASWANANVRDQVVTPFASSGARSSAISSPVAGMLSYITGTKQLEPYDGSAWVSVPGTMLAYGNRQTDKTYSGTEVGVLRLDSISCRSGYRYLIQTGPLRVQVTSGETGKVNLRYSTSGTAGTSDTVLTGQDANANSAFTPANSHSMNTTIAPGTVTLSVLMCLTRSGGSNNVTMTGAATQPIEMWVTMGGPDPTDTGTDI